MCAILPAYHSYGLITYLLNLLAACRLIIVSILLVLKTVDYIKILFFDAYNYTGLDLGLVAFGQVSVSQD